MGSVHRGFVAATVGIFLAGNAVAIAIPHFSQPRLLLRTASTTHLKGSIAPSGQIAPAAHLALATNNARAIEAVPAAVIAPAGSAPDLIIPVEGVASRDLTDTWGAARSEGRHHEGIDIMARFGTPVRAAAAGHIAKLFQSARGGTTVYVFDQTGHLIYYYAHLSAYAVGLREGQDVKQGELIAYVGQTGNATTPHLHFEIQQALASGQWWHGIAMNPYVPLRTAHLPSAATFAAAR